MIDRPPPFQGLKIGIPAIIPVKGRGFINQGSGLLVGIAAEAFEKASHDPEPRFLPARPPAKRILKFRKVQKKMQKLTRKTLKPLAASPSTLNHSLAPKLG